MTDPNPRDIEEKTAMKLLFHGCTVGIIHEPMHSDGTWFGKFELKSEGQDHPDISRAIQFIHFCQRWNESQKSDAPRTANEFENYADVLGDTHWKVVDEKLIERVIEPAPNFFIGEITWQTV